MLECELIIRTWRVTRGIPSGSHVWFDPSTEYVRIYRRPPSDSDEVDDSHEGVDMEGRSGYLDKVGSVSADGQRAAGDSDRYEQYILFEEEDVLPF